MTNEKTSARVAKIAGSILSIEPYEPRRKAAVNIRIGRNGWVPIKWSDIRTLAASALTQRVPDYKHVGRTMDRALRRSAKLVAKGKRRARRK